MNPVYDHALIDPVVSKEPCHSLALLMVKINFFMPASQPRFNIASIFSQNVRQRILVPDSLSPATGIRHGPSALKRVVLSANRIFSQSRVRLQQFVAGAAKSRAGARAQAEEHCAAYTLDHLHVSSQVSFSFSLSDESQLFFHPFSIPISTLVIL